MRTAAFILLVTACAAEPSKSKPIVLQANDDQLAVEMNVQATVDVLMNDVGVDDAAMVTLVDMPAHGTGAIDATGAFTYQPATDYIGADSASYEVENSDGTVADATIAITVSCATCALGVSVTLTWNANAPSDMVEGYRTFLGSTTDTSMMVQIDDIPIDRPGFDPTMPSVSYDGWLDLHLMIGDNACFALKAYNANGVSDFSNPACAIVMHDAITFGL